MSIINNNIKKFYIYSKKLILKKVFSIVFHWICNYLSKNII